MKYKNIITCDKCKKEIKMPNAVIEWRYDNKGSMHVCCHDCALVQRIFNKYPIYNH